LLRHHQLLYRLPGLPWPGQNNLPGQVRLQEQRQLRADGYCGAKLTRRLAGRGYWSVQRRPDRGRLPHLDFEVVVAAVIEGGSDIDRLAGDDFLYFEGGDLSFVNELAVANGQDYDDIPCQPQSHAFFL
jgi:hypothetical protein